MSLKGKFGDKFKTTTQEAFDQHKVKKNNSNRFTYLAKTLKMWRPEEGEGDDKQNRIRLIPLPDVGYFALRTEVHYDVGPDGASTTCPKERGERCPLCEKSRELYNEKKKEAAKEYRASIVHLFYIIDRKHPEEGVQVWALGGTQTMEKIRDLAKDPEGPLIEVDDLDAGFDLFFKKYKKEGSGFDGATFNNINFSRNPSPLTKDEDQAEEWLNFILENPLTEALQFLSTEEIEEAMYGKSDSGDEEEGEEESGSSGGTTARSTQKDDEDEQEEKSAPEKKESSSSSGRYADRLAALKSKAAK